MNFDPLTAGSFGGDAVSVGNAVLIRIDGKASGVMGSFRSADSTFNITGSGQYISCTGWHNVAFGFRFP